MMKQIDSHLLILRVFALAAAALVSISTALSQTQLETQWGHAGSDGAGGRHLTDPNANSLSDSYMSALGHAEIASFYGAVDVGGGIAYSGQNSHSLSAKGIYTDTITITPDDPSLNGQSGTAIFTFHLSGGMSMSYSAPGAVRSYNDFYVSIGDVTYPTGIDYSDGTHTGPVYTDFSSFTSQRAITFGATFNFPVLLGIGANTSRDNGESIAVADQLSLVQGTITVRNNANQAVGYTLTSRTGSARQAIVPAAGSYAGFTLVNPNTNGHVGTTVSLVDGSASSSTVVNAAFTAPPPSSEIQLASDAVDLTGTGSDLVVIQLNYDATLAQSLFGSEEAMRLAWLNPATGEWVNAVLGNTGGVSHFFARAYNSATDFHLGYFGLDTVNHVVWAVINHNSEFGVSAVADPLSITSAVSRKTHGGAGTFDIDLPLTGTPGLECRSGGGAGNHNLVVTFANNVSSGSATVMSGIGNVAGSPSFAGKMMNINLTGVGDAQQISIKLSGVTDSFSQVLPDTVISMGVLLGDTSSNGLVTGTDVSQTKLQSGAPVTNSNFREDVNVSGGINGTDISIVKLHSGTGISGLAGLTGVVGK
jgi:hypothetical protein